MVVGITEFPVLGFLLLLLGRLGLPAAGFLPEGLADLLPNWWSALAAFLFSGVVQALASRAANLTSIKLGQSFSINLREALLEHFSTIPYAELRAMESSEISHLLAEDASKAGQAAQGVIGILSQSILCAAYVLGTLIISPMAAVGVLLLAIPMVLLNRRVSWKKDTLRLRNTMERLTEGAWDYGLNIRTARAHGSDEAVNQRFLQSSSRGAKALVEYQQRTTWLGLNQQLIVFGLFGIFVVLLQHFSGAASSRLLPMAVIYLRLAPRVQSLQQQRVLLSIWGGSLGAILQILRTMPSADLNIPKSSVPAGDIEIRALRFEYEAGKPVLQLDHARIQRGRWTTVVGVSGIGKSTLLRLLTGLEKPTSGEILIGNQSLHMIDGKAWRGGLAYVEQSSSFFHGSLRENLTAFCKTDLPLQESALTQVLNICGLIELIAKMPMGLETPIDERGSQLSSGQKQRISLARALLRKPDFLLLDEATNALDENSERILMQSIRAYLPDSTLISISHRSAAIAFAESIVTLR